MPRPLFVTQPNGRDAGPPARRARERANPGISICCYAYATFNALHRLVPPPVGFAAAFPNTAAIDAFIRQNFCAGRNARMGGNMATVLNALQAQGIGAGLQLASWQSTLSAQQVFNRRARAMVFGVSFGADRHWIFLDNAWQVGAAPNQQVLIHAIDQQNTGRDYTLLLDPGTNVIGQTFDTCEAVTGTPMSPANYAALRAGPALTPRNYVINRVDTLH